MECMGLVLSTNLSLSLSLSGCSYCRHIKRVKTSLSHLILQPPSCSSGEEHEDHHGNCLEEGLWREFLSVKTVSGQFRLTPLFLWEVFCVEQQEALWKRVVYQVYDGGIPSKLRHEVNYCIIISLYIHVWRSIYIVHVHALSSSSSSNRRPLSACTCIL